MLLLLLPASLGAQKEHFLYYSIKEGLAHSQVSSIFCDSAGYLYFTTMGGGVSVFNGKKMKTLGKKQGLRHLSVRACSDGPGNQIYFGTFGGAIYRYESDSVKLISDTAIHSDVYSFCSYQQQLWIGAGNGLHTWDGKRFENVTKKFGLPEYAITFMKATKDGSLWLGYDEAYGLYHIKNGNVRVFNDSNGLTKGRLLNCFEDSHGTIWVSAYNGIYRIDKGKSFAEKEKHDLLPKYYAFEMTEQDGKLIIGATEGIYIYDGEKKTVRFIGDKQGLAWKGVFRTIKDREGNIWISNWGKGVARWVQSGLIQYDAAAGIEKHYQSGFYEEDGALYVCSANGIYKSQGETFVKQKESYVADITTSLFHSKDDKWLAFSTYFTHVVNGKAKDYRIDSLQGVRKFLKDKTGRIWVCGWICGVFQLEDGKVVPIADPLPASMKYYYTGFFDSRGRLWLGSGGAGIIRYDGTWKQLSEKEGLPSQRVTSFAEDEEGNIFAGTPDAGVVKIDAADRITELEGQTHSVLNSVNSLLWHRGWLWIGGIGKIQRVKLKSARIIQEEHWAEEEGFNADCVIDGLYADKRGRVLIASSRFLFAFDEALRHQPSDRLCLHIEKVKVKEQALPVSLMPELKHDMNRVAISFLSTRMQGNSDVSYYYRMKGIDTTYISSNGEHEVIFHELNPGSYTFEAKACKEGHWSLPASVSFVILPPFWKTWWFYLLCALALAGIIFYYIKRRERKLQEDKLRLEKIVEVRTSEISMQKKVIEQKQKETMDSIRYAKRIQTALLPTEKYIDRNLREKNNR